MDNSQHILKKVKDYYWLDDLNCATTNIKVLAEIFAINLTNQVIDAATGMHGAGKYGAQCGLVEGTLMFIGILGRERKVDDATIVDLCKNYAKSFEKRFTSLQCNVLRPNGFNADDPPHLCESLTCAALTFNVDFLQNAIDLHQDNSTYS